MARAASEANWPSLLPRSPGKHRCAMVLGCDPAKFSEVTSDRIDKLGSLPHYHHGPKHQTRRLLLLLFTATNACWGAAPLANSLGIDRVVLLPPQTVLHGGRDQPNSRWLS
jgi:hypothetical protein